MAGHRGHLVLLLEIKHGRSRHRERMLAVGTPITLHTLYLHLHRDPLVYFRIGALGTALQGLRRCLLRAQLLLLLRFPLPGHVTRLLLLLLLRLLLSVVADVRVLLAATASPAIEGKEAIV